jgi:hypothetical protein
LPPYAPSQPKKPWWQRTWDTITHPGQALENALVQWGVRSPIGYKAERRKTGQQIAGALLIILTDLFVGLPCVAVIVLSGAGTPPAIAAEAIEIFVVLPANILGIYLITSASE